MMKKMRWNAHLLLKILHGIYYIIWRNIDTTTIDDNLLILQDA